MAVAKTFVGARLRRLREEQGLTQVALARALDLSTSYVNQLENDQRPVTVPVLLALADHMPRARLEVMAVRGHYPQLSAPEVVIEAIERFLAETPS